MRVAISTEGKNVAVNFGRCPEFTLADIENSKVVKKEIIKNLGHQPGYIPQFFLERGGWNVSFQAGWEGKHPVCLKSWEFSPSPV